MMAGEEGGGSEEGGGFGAGEAGKGRTGAGRGREGSERFKRKHSVPPPGSSSLHVVGTVIRFVLPPTCNDDGPIGRWCGGSHFKLYRPTPLPLQASQIIAAHFQGFVIGQGVVGSHCTSPHLLPLQVRSPQPAVCPPPRCSLLAEEWRVLRPPLPPRAWVQWSGEGEGGCLPPSRYILHGREAEEAENLVDDDPPAEQRRGTGRRRGKGTWEGGGEGGGKVSEGGEKGTSSWDVPATPMSSGREG